MSEQKSCPTCGTEYPLSERFCPRDGTALRSTNAQGDLVGSVIAERYHILKKLGEGGMGTVYLAEHVKMGRKSALKVMNPGMNQDSDAIARFNREASNASRLSHPNICAIYDFGETPDGLIYLAMEFIEGQSLTSLIEKTGSLPAPRAATIIHQAADALGIAHDAGIVHRDLKPDNIMIARTKDGSDLVKVVDFGIAKASSSDAQKVTKTGLVVGTPEYMSPEQLAGDKLDGRSDIYSLGLVAFNCLTGTLPFPSNSAQEAMIMRLTDHPKTLSEMKPDVEWPAELERVMAKVLARDAVDRYQSAPEFGREIAKAVENMPQALTASAATQVIGARTAALPATRVASGGGATAKVEAAKPAAGGVAKRKSPMPMVIGAAVVLAAAVGGYAMMNKGGTAPASPAGAPAGVPTGAPAGVPAAAPVSDGEARKADGGAAAPTVTALASGKAQSATKTVAPNAAPARMDGAKGAAPTLSVDAELARLSPKIDDPNLDKATASNAIPALERIIASGISGSKLGTAYYLRGLAHAALDDAAYCSDMRRAKPLVTSRDETTTIDNFLKNCK